MEIKIKIKGTLMKTIEVKLRAFSQRVQSTRVARNFNGILMKITEVKLRALVARNFNGIISVKRGY